MESRIASIRVLPQLFVEQRRALGGQGLFYGFDGREFRATSWDEAYRVSSAIAYHLRAHGVAAGDRVVLLSENRVEWSLAYLGIIRLGAIVVPSYSTNAPSDHAHVSADSGASCAIVSSARLARAFAEARVPILVGFERDVPSGAPNDASNGAANGSSDGASGGARGGATQEAYWARASLAELTDSYGLLGAADRERFEADIDARGASLEDTKSAVIYYTSGTSGTPRGVMLTHRNLLSNCRAVLKILQGVPNFRIGSESFLSFLPLSHSYEHLTGLVLPLYIGARVYYCPSLDKLLSMFGEVRPTLTTAVPRLFEMIYGRLNRTVAEGSALRRFMFESTTRVGMARLEEGSARGVAWRYRLGALLFGWLVRRKVRRRFGGRLRALVSGGGPLNPAVGPPLDGVEVRLAADGEILVRGDNVMAGYWNNEEATSAAIDDEGWLHTGDVGVFTDEGLLKIVDRKKDIIVTSGGKNVAPQKIETLLNLCPELAQSMVYGDGKAHLVALVVLDEVFLAQHAAAEERQRHVSAALGRVNAELSAPERLRHFIVADEAFSVENGELTPSMKIRRHKICARYGARLEQLYAKPSGASG